MKKTVLAIGAHPDDIEIGCGGTLALLKRQGARLIYVIVSSGEEGSLTIAPKKLGALRESEAQKAGKVLGAAEVCFLHEPDGLTSFSKETKLKLMALLRKHRPDIVFTHTKSDQSPDHRVVHDLTIDAIRGASGPWYPGAKGQPHSVAEIFAYEVWSPLNSPQTVVDISSTMALKLKALACHESQIADVNYVEAVKGLARYRGVMSLGGSEYGEAFEIIRQEFRGLP